MRHRSRSGTVIDFPVHRVRPADDPDGTGPADGVGPAGPPTGVVITFPTHHRPAPLTDVRLERMRQQLAELVRHRGPIGGVPC